jgi:hypothetical protein
MQRRDVADIPEAFEQYLKSLSDDDWSALTGRVRSTGGPTDALKAAVAKHISDDRLNAVMAIVNPAAFLGDDGSIDEAKVGQQLGTLFGGGGQPTGARPGDAGRAAAAKRFGTPPETPATSTARVPQDSEVQKGRPVRDPGAVELELQKRFGDRRFGDKENN